MIERASRIATAASTLLILGLLLWLHPDMTPPLQMAGAAAFLAAWIAAGWRAEQALAACVIAAPLAPALLRLATGREQPVLDVVWMAALGGALLRQAPLSRWRLPSLWRPLAGGWALTLALAWPVLAGREAGFDVEGLRDWGAVVSWAFWPAPHAISWTLYWVLIQFLGLLWLDAIAARLAADPVSLPRSAHAFWIGASAASVVAVVQGALDLDFLNPPFWASLGRATGTMLEANGYGHTAALAGPVAFVAIRSLRPSLSAWAWAALGVNWMGVWMSGSRTALLCAGFGAAGLMVGLWRAGERASRRHALIAAGAIVPAAALIVLAAGATGPLRRLAEIPLDRASLTDFWERGGYGSIAAQILREYPLTGTGAGTFHYIAPDYWRVTADDALAPDNAQNWWRHQAAELGILGGAAVLLWSAVLAWHVVGGRASTSGPGTVSGPVVRGLLAGIGVSSLVGVPTQNPVVLIGFLLLAGWLAAIVREPGPAGAVGDRWTGAAWAVAALLAIAYAGGHVLLARGPLSVAERARRFEREYVSGAHQPEQLPSGAAFRWTDDRSRFVLPARTPWLVIRVRADHPDIGETPVRVMISARCGVVWDDVLRSREPVILAVALPENSRVVDATVEVGRTWQPSAFGSGDSRDLGVAVSWDFVGSADQAEGRTHVRWPACRTAGE